MKYAQIDSTITALQPVIGYYDTDLLDYQNLPAIENLVLMNDEDWELRRTNHLDYFNGGFSVHSTPQPGIDELRELMSLAKVDAKLRLIDRNLFDQVNDIIKALPDNSKVKIMWTDSERFHRLNPELVYLCKNQLGMTDAEIDEFFTG